MFPPVPKELAQMNSELVSSEPTEDDALDWYNQARDKAVSAVLAEFVVKYPSHAKLLTEFEEFLERGEDESGFAFVTTSAPSAAEIRRQAFDDAIKIVWEFYMPTPLSLDEDLIDRLKAARDAAPAPSKNSGDEAK